MTDQFKGLHPNQWDAKTLLTIVEKFSEKKVVVIGDLGVDRYTMGLVERISPEAPVPIVSVENEEKKLGLAANVANNIKALEGDPRLVGVLGQDYFADEFLKLLEEREISEDFICTESTHRTILKDRVVSGHQQLLRIDYDPAMEVSPSLADDIFFKYEGALDQSDVVILEDYGKGLLDSQLIERCFEAGARAGKKILVDPNMRVPLESYQGAFLLTPNKKEAEVLTGILIKDGESLSQVGEKILAQTQAENVIVTLGKDGMAIFSQGKREAKIIPTFAQEVYDVSGAGDTVISVIALALASGGSIEDAAVLGNLAAGIVVSKRGTATLDRAELLEVINYATGERPAPSLQQ